MSKTTREGIVYSTDVDFQYREHKSYTAEISPREQDLRIGLERKSGNKTVTIIRGFSGSVKSLNNLAKELRNMCGAGGSSKDGEILIQGEHRDKILAALLKKGFRAKKAGG